MIVVWNGKEEKAVTRKKVLNICHLSF